MSARGRPGRPRSPPSMYVAYESSTAKTPKPLIKLDKHKASSATGKGKVSVPTSPAASTFSERSLPKGSSGPPFFSLRRKQGPPSQSSSDGDSVAGPSRRRPALHVAMTGTPPLHQTNVHPYSDVDSVLSLAMPRPTHPNSRSKVARLLGKSSYSSIRSGSGSGSGSSKSQNDDEGCSVFSDSGSGGGSFEERRGDGGDADYATAGSADQETPPLTPILFRPITLPGSSAGEHQASSSSSAGGREVEDEGPTRDDASELSEDRHTDSDGPVTPVAASLPAPPRPRRRNSYNHQHHLHGRSYRHEEAPSESDAHSVRPQSALSFMSAFGGVNDRYTYTQATSTSTHGSVRADTPFMDGLVEVSSVVSVVAGQKSSRRVSHLRSTSVVRAEPKQGWMGEWNQGDMQEVISKLRELR
ncbi:unnamed protein product [Mycena citricolor]|uniref:Uncharacterized protein n=1 Tax=Mycena citricolor TaxID=2018698 RepID=A0AAD2HZ09_9AGAR|nr:unnamed protein product [Mycena citricolor]